MNSLKFPKFELFLSVRNSNFENPLKFLEFEFFMSAKNSNLRNPLKTNRKTKSLKKCSLSIKSLNKHSKLPYYGRKRTKL
jgi:hypothetical protein